MSRGNVTYAPTGETTEWEDILVAKGIIEARDDGKNDEEEPDEPAEPQHRLEGATLDDLDEFEDEIDEEEEAMMNAIRERRMAEMKEKASRSVHGSIREILKPEWVTEVTEASNNGWVLCQLYQSYNQECQILTAALQGVAAKFPEIKIVKIVATQAVENWPDRNLPTLFMYNGGDLAQQIFGLKQLNGAQTNADDLEWRLAEMGVLQTEMEEDPRLDASRPTMDLRRGFVQQRGSDDEDYED